MCLDFGKLRQNFAHFLWFKKKFNTFINIFTQIKYFTIYANSF